MQRLGLRWRGQHELLVGWCGRGPIIGTQAPVEDQGRGHATTKAACCGELGPGPRRRQPELHFVRVRRA
jgi:hypothetical protein